ncbi:MAG: hypothetical protein RR497_05425 [Oscillospiraceae bacterium]
MNERNEDEGVRAIKGNGQDRSPTICDNFLNMFCVHIVMKYAPF